jgi:N-acetyl-gamma-glutamyl-phosphate/LysW-gamma-L-alpha-aminoadipyl-6-phosphate reductase
MYPRSLGSEDLAALRAQRVAVLGASGYTGGELLRILAVHPEVEVVYASSREYAGLPVYYAHPHLRGFYRLRLSRLTLDSVLRSEPDTVFSALPHGVGLEFTARLYEAGIRVVDLSADYRLKTPESYKQWYGFEHPYPDLLAKAVYGLPELHREELRGARLIAVPGCNATAVILSVAPLVAKRLIGSTPIIADVKASSSEAGSKPSRWSHHPEREGDIRPYSASGHRHAAEAEQELARLAGGEVRVSLVPHAVPAVRGVLASAHTFLASGVEEADVARAYAEFYRGEPLVRVVHGKPVPWPSTRNVLGSNIAEVGYAVEARLGRATGFAAIDNLARGAAGQAVQAFNISAGFPETTGLLLPPLHP